MLRLRLKPIETQIMWLGCGQQLKHVETAAEPDQDPGHAARLRPATKAPLKHVDTAAEPDQDPRHVARLKPATETCCLRLNPTKTQVMWLGSGQQLKHVDTAAEPDQDPGHVARLRPATEAC